MTRTEHLHLLAATASEQAVVHLATRFLEAWQPHELAAIPPGCRPRAPRDGEDLADIAFDLTRARMETSAANHLLEEMETFFAHACARISELEAAPLRVSGKSYLTR